MPIRLTMASVKPSLGALGLLLVELIVVVNVAKFAAASPWFPNGLRQLVLNI